MDRRTFINRGGRVLIFTGMAAGTAFLAFSGRVASPENCDRSDLCQKCRKSDSCPKFPENQKKENGKQ